jgi:predicted Fe-Mo cluster-binding NifX family protein
VKIAVPLFGTRIAPRLCFATELLLVLAGDSEAMDCRNLNVGQFPDHQSFVNWVVQQGIGVVLCCGVNHRTSAELVSRGIQVVCGLTGESTEVVRAYLDGTLDVPPGRHNSRNGTRRS